MSEVERIGSLTKAARKYHLKTAGQDRCPFCKVEIDLDTVEYLDLDPVEDGTIEQTAHCLKCGKQWMDVFKLVDILELYDGPTDRSIFNK